MYYIYHIPGVKIGCTNNIHRRLKLDQKTTSYEILEEYDDIMIASKRELQLQRKYGYTVDCVPYYISVKNQFKSRHKGNTKEARAKAVANTDYKKRVENTDYKLIASKIDYKENGKKISKAVKGRIPWNKGLKLQPLTEEQKLKISISCKKVIRKRNKLGQYEKN